MKMTHKGCGGEITESQEITPYQSEEFGTVPAYQCNKCKSEITGDSCIEFIPENLGDRIQIEALQEQMIVCPRCGIEIEVM